MTDCTLGCKNFLMVRFVLLFCLFAVLFPSNAFSRNYIHIVGSSVVFPFTTVVSEEFSKAYRTRTPIVESTGSGSGINLFCSGTSLSLPDAVNSSRPMNDIERDMCNKNGVSDIIEIKLGYDAIVFARTLSAPQINLSKSDIFKALALYLPDKTGNKLINNNNLFWSDIKNTMPSTPIEIYGPPRNTGTYEVMTSIAFLDVCMKNKAFQNMYPSTSDLLKACSITREDGKFIEVGYDESVILRKMNNNNNIVGIFSYHFLHNNRSVISPSKINGIEPNYQTISSGEYVLSRPMYIYVKSQNIEKVKDLKLFLNEIISSSAIGPKGYLTEYGLVSLPDDEIQKHKNAIEKYNQT